MAIDDLPVTVVNFLNVIGVAWPYVDEDVVARFAALTRDFGTAVQTTHDNATAAVQGIAKAHQAQSTRTMSSGWASLSDTHVSEIVTGCTVLAGALDVASGYIVAQKVIALGVLVGMAAAFIGDQAAALLTFGVAEVAAPLIVMAGRKVMKALVMDLEQYLIGQVIEVAATPLFAKVEQAMAGLDWSKSGAATAGSGTGYTVDPDAVRAQTAVLRTHASTMLGHGQQYQRNVRELNF